LLFCKVVAVACAVVLIVVLFYVHSTDGAAGKIFEFSSIKSDEKRSEKV